MNPNINTVVSQITAVVAQIVSIGLLVLILAAVLAAFGVSQRIIPTPNPTALAYLCGAWWLYRGGKL